MPLLPGPLRLSVNAGPDTYSSRELLDLLESSTPSRSVVELTEHVGIGDHPGLRRACRDLRALGTHAAIDDAGTGFAGVSMVLEVAPDYIKLDRELVSGTDVDPVRRVLAGALVIFGRDTGAEVIAEGVETAAELEVPGGLGIADAQGFYLGRPGSPEDLSGLIRVTNQCRTD